MIGETICNDLFLNFQKNEAVLTKTSLEIANYLM